MELQQLSQQQQHNRLVLISRVQRKWIEKLLEPSLSPAGQLNLALEDQARALPRSRDSLIQEWGQASHEVLEGKTITQVYDETTLNELVILGDPGSGKTTLLLELTRNLLDRAKRDESQPIPVVFPLSSWVVKRQPLADWLVEELSTQYRIPPLQGQTWIQTDQVLPLLDGLDDVVTSRKACVKAINTFRQEHGLVPVVVCCRSADYQRLELPLLIQRVVKVLPPTKGQIEQYLGRIFKQRESVDMALQDTQVRKLLRIPLILYHLALICQDSSIELEKDIPARLQQAIFQSYLTKILQFQEGAAKWDEAQIRLWLVWIAQLVQKDKEKFFTLESFTPNDLPEEQSFPYCLSVWLVFMAFALLGGLIWHQCIHGLTVLFTWMLQAPNFCHGSASQCIQIQELIKSARDFFLLPIVNISGTAIGAIIGFLEGKKDAHSLNLSMAFPRFGMQKRWSRNNWKALDVYNTFERLEDQFSGTILHLCIGFLLGTFFFNGFGTSYIFMGLIISLCFSIFPFLLKYSASSILRFFFWTSNCLPWNIVAFLSECIRYRLLYREDNRYRFIHPLFCEYLASNGKQPKSQP